jgi:FecR protein/Putative zinc-finger
MKNENLDHLLSAIRNEQVDEKVVAQARERVWNSIAGVSSAEVSSPVLRTCADFQALIPGYLSQRLAPARALLFEDHIHACVACRRALEQARQGAPQQVVLRGENTRRTSSIWQWSVGAAAVALIAFVTFSFNRGLLPGQHPIRAAVESIDGSLYSVEGGDVQLIPTGYPIRNGEEIRTAKGSTAVVRLLDGSLVEMGERADVAVARGWKGTTIHLDGGQVIVQAAKQRVGRLYLATDDCLVSVEGTIFSVNHGIKGSRVSVIEGVVRMEYGERTAELHAGDQASTNASVSKVPIQDDIAWSRNAAKYLALLGDFAVLQKQLAAIPGPGLRYSSDLLPYVPEHTVIFAAIPNLTNTLTEADRLFRERLQQSPALRNWWQQQQKHSGSNLEDLFSEVKKFSSYLGDEIVFAAGKNGSTYTAPVILGRVRQAGLEEFVQTEAARVGSNPAQAGLQAVRDPWAVQPMPGHPLLVYVNNGLMIASPDVAELQRSVMRVREGGGSPFSTTPFHEQIVHAYQEGAEWLFCADMEQIVVQNVPMDGRSNQLPPGIGDVRYLMMEHRDLGGKSQSRAALSFASERQGVASWLAAPASMGSLDFVSPDASMVTSAVIKNPRSIMEEVFQMIGSGDPNFDQDLAKFEARTGVNVLNDITQPLGGEVTMAFDGPVLPTPRWKLIFEVYDPPTLQSTIEKLVDSFNREDTASGHSLQLTNQKVGSQTYFTIRSSNAQAANSEVDYAFVDSYLVAAPDIATISRAIQSRLAGYTLSRSTSFQALLPSDGYTNFSAIFYHNIGPVVGPLADQLKSSGALTPQQRQSIDALAANSAPGLIYAYGQPDRIVVASNSGFMGFDLSTFLTMGNNGPFLPQMLLGGALSHPSPQTQ